MAKRMKLFNFLAGKLISKGCHMQYVASNNMMIYPPKSMGYEFAELYYKMGRLYISIGTEFIV